MEDQPKIEILSVGLNIDVCGGLILPLFKRQGTYNDFKSHIVEPGWHYTCKSFSSGPTFLDQANLLRAAKVSGVIIFLGVSGWLCYRFIRAVWFSVRSKVLFSKSPSFASLSSSNSSDEKDEQELFDEDSEDFIEIKHAYFGPTKTSDRDEDNSPLDFSDAGDFTLRQKPKIWKLYDANASQKCFNHPNENKFRYLHSFSTSTPQLQYSFLNNISSSSKDSRKTDYTSSSSVSSPFCSLSKDRSKLNFSFDQPYESPGYSFNLYGGGSLDSIASEISIDISSLCETPLEQTTISLMDKLQQEIMQIKTNCNSMTEDFTQVKLNRFLPGLSSLIDPNSGVDCNVGFDENHERQKARDCFKGLYSLTTLSNSISFDMSECGDICTPPIRLEDKESETDPFDWRGGSTFRQEDLPSLEWDECDMVEEGDKSFIMTKSSGYDSTLVDSCSTLQQMTESQVWTSEGEFSPQNEVPEKEVLDSNRLSLFDKTCNETNDISAVENISCDIDLMEYAEAEWHGGTPKAKTIINGYKEIRNKYHYRYLRRIRGDNYCAIRASLFQCMSSGIPMPNCDEALHVIKSSFDSDSNHWLRQWSFVNRLPYNQNKLLPSIEACLHTLDDISSQLSTCTTDRSNVLAELMNSEPTLDLLMMEAVKLHMIVSAIKLYSSESEMPTFGMLLFARDSSETPKDFMNNHLLPVGDTGGLEQIEMFLLGYTLGVSIKVFRVSSFGTPEFISFFPDPEENFNCPEVTIIAEDDRHYNVLVQ